MANKLLPAPFFQYPLGDKTAAVAPCRRRLVDGVIILPEVDDFWFFHERMIRDGSVVFNQIFQVFFFSAW